MLTHAENAPRAGAGGDDAGARTRFLACKRQVLSVLAKYPVDRPADLTARSFYIFSYFHERAADAGLIGARRASSFPVYSSPSHCTPFLKLWALV